MTDFFVEIRRLGGDENDPGFRRMGPMSEHVAKKVKRGASINLNHRDYYVVIIPDPPPPAP